MSSRMRIMSETVDGIGVKKKWAHLGSNQGPTGYEPVALPAELWALFREAIVFVICCQPDQLSYSWAIAEVAADTLKSELFLKFETLNQVSMKFFSCRLRVG